MVHDPVAELACPRVTQAVVTMRQRLDPAAAADIDATLEALTRHGMVHMGGCRCGGQWPCATALDLAAAATRQCDRLIFWPGRW